jgi:hypothetical protein
MGKLPQQAASCQDGVRAVPGLSLLTLAVFDK